MRQFRNVLELAVLPTSEGLSAPREIPREFRPKEVRPLGAYENIFAAYNEAANTNFALMVDLHGEITRTGVERALAQVQARHPLLGVGIRRNAKDRRVFARSLRPIPLKELPTGAVPWELAAGLEIRRRFDVEAGPLMAAAIRFEPKSVRVLLTFHHSIADGLSAVFVIRDLVRALSGERLGHFIEAASLDDRLARLPHTHSACPEEAGTGDAPPALDPETLWRWGRGMSVIPTVSSLALSREVTRQLREVARFHDATVHSALSVALARAMGETRGTGSDASRRAIRIMSPVSIRRMLSIHEECGVFLGGGCTELQIAGNSFWDEARRARAALEPFVNSDTVHGMIGGMAAFRARDDTPAGARAAFAAALNFDAMLSNLGALPIPARYGRIRIKSIAGPISLACLQDEHVIGAATLEDQMVLTYTSTAPLSGLLPRVEKKLMDACAAW